MEDDGVDLLVEAVVVEAIEEERCAFAACWTVKRWMFGRPVMDSKFGGDAGRR